MIALSNEDLPPKVATNLRRFQAEVSALPDYASRVEAAKRLWTAKTKGARRSFVTVHETLVKIHRNDTHCCYCGFSAADAIDHFRPHSLYPELTFVWENYVHTCSRCNNVKGAQFAVFSLSAPNEITEVTRKAGMPIVPPIAGEPVLIDPRRENPMDFLFMDFFSQPGSAEHSRYRPLPALDNHARIRAEYTIQLLELNKRNDLAQGRQSAYGSYRDKLAEYVRLKQAGHTLSQLEHRVTAIKLERHRAVWEEMKRWHRNEWRSRDDDLRIVFENFEAAPEALTW